MPRVIPKQHRFKADQVVICFETFAHEKGVVQRGERYRGGDEVVQSHPLHFLDAGIPESEWPNPWARVIAAAPPDPVPAATIVDLPPPERQVQAVQGFSIGLGIGRGSIAKGQVFDQDDPLVRKHPELFERPAQPFKPEAA